MHLYWGFWSVLQVGSIIAILGVVLHISMSLINIPKPSWGIALGTPVLVFAGLGWNVVKLGEKAKNKVRARGSGQSGVTGGEQDGGESGLDGSNESETSLGIWTNLS